MKVKLDENLPSELALVLVSRGHDVHTVPEESMVGEPDESVLAEPESHNRHLTTQDLDPSHIRRFAPDTHLRIFLRRLRAPGKLQIHERVQQDCDPIRFTPRE